MKFKDIFIGAGISIILVCFLFTNLFFMGQSRFPEILFFLTSNRGKLLPMMAMALAAYQIKHNTQM